MVNRQSPSNMSVLHRISVDLQHERTLAAQLRQQITWLIASGQLQAGDSLPSVRVLAQHLGINVHTVHSAYQKLEAAGLVETRHGSGTRVRPLAPGALAQISSSLRSHTVGVILPWLDNPFYHALLDGIEEVANADRTLLFVCATHDDPSEAWRYLAQLSARQVDGVIVASHDISDLATPGAGNGKKGLPLVSVDWPEGRGDAVLMDLKRAGYQATSHLLSHGHRRVGLITRMPAAANISPLEAGYRQALKEAGLAPSTRLMARVTGFGVGAGAGGARVLLSLARPPTAIFAVSDLLAIGALCAIKEAGLRVPGDVALAGFNDSPIASMVDPPLTTVAAPARQMGMEAMQMLQRRIAGEEPVDRRVVLPVSLVIRASCGPHELPSWCDNQAGPVHGRESDTTG
jgi:DNA-binding LacI/PurR family transcriptional regulator